MQSAYRSHHSTETALLRVYNDLLLAVDREEEAVLVLLDYSAASDTINHNLFFGRLINRYDISDTVLNWFKTCRPMTNRGQVVTINGKKSVMHVASKGVPQGSVIGPSAFIMYTASLKVRATCKINF